MTIIVNNLYQSYYKHADYALVFEKNHTHFE
jgi:hypothetical protein